ncbi:dihydrodipicolinate synthase family protein [Pseudaminobacter sp. 19-2017]|uniref:Dihydrodipicolinate synthase family protein n=1 Tax=Pseudaminobacter soli (ex Zhang et al. 2022) TaxID=2831468 RepID=A0A942DYZ1_9HYPH|nr:dihydrodipicolinate synthase family protein [Pseudaminobacter soli]MBS3650206.1 dihydrodipicolinate synthase family protein [Pseudaminobacter soli]
MTKVSWSGVLPALATPFAADGSIDKDQLKQLVDLLLSEGVSGFVVGGSTGEYYSMSISERADLFETVFAHVAGRGTVIAGTSSTNHSETLELTKVAKQIGYDGCMVLPPVYCLPTPSEIVKAFEDVAAIGLPIMVYNNPARVGVALSPSLTAQLAALPGVAAYKESARDLYAVAEVYYATRDRLAHFAGLEPYASALLSRGASGIVSTISNVCAREVVNYYKTFRENDADALSRNQQVIDQLYHLLARSGLANFAFVKGAMAALSRPGGVTRSPHRMADQAQIEKIGTEIREIYARAGVEMKQA